VEGVAVAAMRREETRYDGCGEKRTAVPGTRSN